MLSLRYIQVLWQPFLCPERCWSVVLVQPNKLSRFDWLSRAWPERRPGRDFLCPIVQLRGGILLYRARKTDRFSHCYHAASTMELSYKGPVWSRPCGRFTEHNINTSHLGNIGSSPTAHRNVPVPPPTLQYHLVIQPT